MSQITPDMILADLNLVVWFGIALCIYTSKKHNLVDFNLAVMKADHQIFLATPPPPISDYSAVYRHAAVNRWGWDYDGVM